MYTEDVETAKITLMRTVTGAHTQEICVVKPSLWFSIVVTGSVKGELGVWDFESSMLKAYLIRHTDFVTDATFLEPRPLLVTSGADGLVCIWSLTEYTCIHCFQNKSSSPLIKNSELQESAVNGIRLLKLTEPIVKVKKARQMLLVETYRSFEKNYVLSECEDQTLYKADGCTFKSPDEIETARKELLKLYNK